MHTMNYNAIIAQCYYLLLERTEKYCSDLTWVIVRAYSQGL